MGLRRPLLGATLAVALAGVLTVTPAGAAGIEVTTEAAAEGIHGLRVLFGPDCPAAHTLVLDADDGPLQGVYEACRTVLAEAVAVQTGTATLRAGDEIALGNGFQVDPSAALELTLDSSLSGGPTYVEDRSPIDETVYSARYSARLDSLVLAPGESVGTLVAYSTTWEEIFRVVIQPASGGGFELSLAARQDGGGMVQSLPGTEIAVPAGWHTVELEWSAGAGDGQLRLAVDGAALSGLTSLDNAATAVETVRWGAIDGDLFTSAGTIELDTYSSTR